MSPIPDFSHCGADGCAALPSRERTAGALRWVWVRGGAVQIVFEAKLKLRDVRWYLLNPVSSETGLLSLSRWLRILRIISCNVSSKLNFQADQRLFFQHSEDAP